jgi:hypothetical protein
MSINQLKNAGIEKIRAVNLTIKKAIPKMRWLETRCEKSLLLYYFLLCSLSFGAYSYYIHS